MPVVDSDNAAVDFGTIFKGNHSGSAGQDRERDEDNKDEGQERYLFHALKV
jgi:hypothetical protein